MGLGRNLEAVILWEEGELPETYPWGV